MEGESRIMCMYCGEELWGLDERGGVCRSCQGVELDEAADDWAAYHAGVGPPYDDDVPQSGTADPEDPGT